MTDKRCGTCRWYDIAYSNVRNGWSECDYILPDRITEKLPTGIKLERDPMHADGGKDCPCWDKR